MKSYFESKPGDKSMIRLLAFMGFIVGSSVALWGMALISMLTIAVIKGVEGAGGSLGTLLMVVSAGLALAGSSEALKVIQQRKEGAVPSKEVTYGSGS